MTELSPDNVALVALLTRGPTMQWAQYRDELALDALPSDLVTDSAERRRGETTLNNWLNAAAGANFYSYLDAGYPAQLSEVWDFPPFVFLQGDETPLHSPHGDRGICIVGSRSAASGAVDVASYIARSLAEEGITIVSGLAAGIDYAAHNAAVQAGARTVGVIGTGIDRCYPPSSCQLQQRLAAGHGMVLSQFPPGSSPTRSSFPMRNGVMSAYGNATIIVAADEKSGTRHQARQAIRHGRPLILAEPVARETTWGKKLADDPLVDAHVARTPDDAIDLARSVLNRRSPIPAEATLF